MQRSIAGVFVVLILASVSLTAAEQRSLEGSYYPPVFHERMEAVRAVETVYWNHRIWPEQNPGLKPLMGEVIPEEVLRAKVEETLRKSLALEIYWGRPLTHADLQAEMDRMAATSRRPAVLAELFAAVDNDPMLIAEALVRPRLVDRLIREAYAATPPVIDETSFDTWWAETSPMLEMMAEAPTGPYAMPTGTLGCTDDSWAATPSRAPDSRRGHSVVWTGSEMIVFGGQTATGYLATAGRYDPATDTWTETSAAPLSARAWHSAVWTGTEMIVWGGWNGTYERTGARYDPLTNVWTNTPIAAGVPGTRASHTAIWTGTQMIIWGGTNGSIFGDINHGSRYDPVTDLWASMSSIGAPTGRSGHTAFWTGSEMIVWGGQSPVFMSAPVYYNTGGRYDPASNTWGTATSTGVNVPSSRAYHAAAWTGNDLIVWGGRTGANSYTNTGGRYNATTDSWTPTSTGVGVPAARQFTASAWTGSELVVWGGDHFSGSTVFHDTGGFYDPGTDSWTPTSTGTGKPTARTQHSGVWTGSELIVWGGIQPGNVHVNTGGRLAPSTNSWSTTALGTNVPLGRSRHSAVWTGAEMIVWGGSGVPVGGGSTADQETGGRYDPATNSWQTTSVGANVPGKRASHTVVWTGSRMIVWGGTTQSTYYDDGGSYDPLADSWTAPSITGTPSGRTFHTAIWTGMEMIVWGGSSNVGGRVNTGGRYNPLTDSWTATSTGANVPSARNAHTAVWAGDDMIVWGGVDTGYINTGGRYDIKNDSWAATSLAASVPQARGYHTAIWTGDKMVVWGGSYYSGGSIELDTGGQYDAQTNQWTATNTGANVPTARSDHKAVWTREEMIVWGGFSSPNWFDSGGRYDPDTNSWTATDVGQATPFGRTGHSAVWADGEMIVWGGGSKYSSGGRYCACSSDLPSAVPVLKLTRPSAGSTTARLTWLTVTDATGYDVVTGELSTLHSSDGDFSQSTNGCLAQNQASTVVDDARTLTSGQGVWYLMRGLSCGGDGSYDTGGSGQSGLRDAEVHASGCACP